MNASSLSVVTGTFATPAGGEERGWLQITDGRIAARGAGAPPAGLTGRRIDLGGHLVLPGFIDVHVHGAMGVGAMDARESSLQTMAEHFARHGVTSFLPTTMTDGPEPLRRALEVIAACTGRRPGGATILGAHVEGPYLNAKRCGAQKLEWIRRADPAEARVWFDLGVVRLLALAPEYAESRALITECVRRGVTVSAAHTDATFADLQTAVALGLRQTTHTFNAMSALHHREPGVVGAALTLPELRCELIADNLHVHPAVMAVLHQAKGRDGVILISDAVPAAGLPDGHYPMDEGREVWVKDGAVRLPDGTLAGSTLMMDQALVNYARATGRSSSYLWPATSLNAARALGVETRKGSLDLGRDADLVALTPSGKVVLTVVQGEVVHQSAG
jgi:N-acetylglucosamine-6-phosphate deacetylase